MKTKNNRRKIAFIGTSYLFVHQAVRDFLLCGHLENSDLFLYDIDPDPLQVEFDIISRMIRDTGSDITVTRCRTRRQALDKADYVMVSVLVGGLDTADKEDKLCQKYNIRHTVGDTVGPMCTARCLRQIPLLLDIARDMKKYCPGAPLLSPTNPMAVLTTVVIRHGDVNCIGICHGTHFSMQIIARSYNVPLSKVAVNVVGVNHLAFVDKVWINGREKTISQVIKKSTAEALKGYKDPAGHIDKADCAIQFAARTGYIPNNGDHHFTEFFPWFLSPQAFCKTKNKYGLNDRLLNIKKRKQRKKDLRKLLHDWTFKLNRIPDMDKYGGEHINDISPAGLSQQRSEGLCTGAPPGPTDPRF